MQGQHGAVKFDPVIDGRLERQESVVAGQPDKGEIVELLQRVDIDLGERLELFLRIGAVTVGIEALHRHGRIELVERPGVADAGDLVVGTEDDLRAHGRPDMRMRIGAPSTAGQDCADDGGSQKKLAALRTPSRQG